jgi:hypothetical protein
MKIVRVRYEYSETRSYQYHSVHIGQAVEAELGEGERASQVLDELKAHVRARVTADADEEQAKLIRWLEEAQSRTAAVITLANLEEGD